MDQTGTIAELFEACGYKYTDLEENSFLNVEAEEIEILSYNITTKQKEYKQVIKLVRKQDNYYFNLANKDTKKDVYSYPLEGRGYIVLLQGTGHHKVYDPIRQKYITLQDIAYTDNEEFHILDSNNNVIKAYCWNTQIIGPVLDIEVADNACYFSNDILSHNTVTGGNALKFYASQRVDIRRIGGEKEGDVIVANKTRVKVVKNKVAPPFREAEFLIRYGVGIDRYADLIATALSLGVIERGGAIYTIGDTKYKGINAVTTFLHENPDEFVKLQEQVNAAR